MTMVKRLGPTDELKRLVEAGDGGEPCKIEAGFLLVANPKFAPDNGANPYLGLDLYAVLALAEAAERERETDRQQIDELKAHNCALMNGVEAEGKSNWAARDKLNEAERVIAPFAAVGGALRGPSVEYSVRAPWQRLPVVSAQDFVTAFSWLARHATGQKGGDDE